MRWATGTAEAAMGVGVADPAMMKNKLGTSFETLGAVALAE